MRAYGLMPIGKAPDTPDTRRVQLDLGNCALDMMSPTKTGLLADFLELHGEAPYSLTFEVEDLDTTYHFIVDKGVVVDITNQDAYGTEFELDTGLTNGVTIRLIQPS